jgi:hypothetical protein
MKKPKHSIAGTMFKGSNSIPVERHLTMPAYEELDLVGSGEGFEIREHNVNRQDASKPSYGWPKVRISETPDWNTFLYEWYNLVGGEANGSLEDLIQNGLNHAISVVKDPSRETADPAIKQFKSDFRKALGAGDGATLTELKAQNADLFNELRDAHIEREAKKAAALNI